MDRERLLNAASSDPDIDVDNFSSYMDYHIGEGEKTVPQEDEMASVVINSNELQEAMPNRATKSRPGMSGRLRNILPNSDDPEEQIWRGDKIDLDTYQKMSHDAQIAFGTYLFKGWISSLPYTIESPDDNLKNIVDHIVGQEYKSILRNMITTGFKNGFVFGEKIWNREHAIISAPNEEGKPETIYEGPLVKLREVKFLDPRQNFKFFINKKDKINRVEQRQGVEEVSVDRSKLLWFALDQEFSNVFGSSRYKNIYPEWYFSKINNQYQLNDLQKRGSPHVEVRYPRGKSKLDGEQVSNRKVALKIAEQMMSDGVVAIPSEVHDEGEQRWNLKYADVKREADTNPFIEYLNYNAKRKMKGIGIPPAIASDASNFSSMDASGDMLTVIIEDVVDQIEDTIQKDIVDQIVENNFGPKKKSIVNFKINRSALGRRSMMKEILKTMIKTGTSMKGKTLRSWPSVVDMMRDLGISSASLDEVFSDQVGDRADRAPGETPVDEEENIEDSNNTDGDGARDEVDDRDRDRSTDRDDATQ